MEGFEGGQHHFFEKWATMRTLKNIKEFTFGRTHFPSEIATCSFEDENCLPRCERPVEWQGMVLLVRVHCVPWFLNKCPVDPPKFPSGFMECQRAGIRRELRW